MQRIGLLLAGLWLGVSRASFAGAPPPPPPTTTEINLCKGAGGTIVNGKCNITGQKELTGDNGFLGDVTNTLLLVAGAIAVIIIILAGIRYVTSTGDAARIKAAKDTLLYAVIGLIVVVLAYAIVRFVSQNVG